MEAFFRGEITPLSATDRRRYQSELTINSSLKPYTSKANAIVKIGVPIDII